MDTTAKKPRAKAINAHWVAVDAAGWLYLRTGENDPLVHICGPKQHMGGQDLVDEHHHPTLKHARKGGRYDLDMAAAVERQPAARAAILAAALAASTPAAAPTATRKSGRL